MLHAYDIALFSFGTSAAFKDVDSYSIKLFLKIRCGVFCLSLYFVVWIFYTCLLCISRKNPLEID